MGFQSIIEFLRGPSFSQAIADRETVKADHRRYLLRNAIRFAEAMERVDTKAIIVGEHRDSGREVLAKIPFQSFLGHHLIQGRSGSGKSRYAESLILQLLQTFPEVGLTIVDGKGELFERVRGWIAALLFRMDEKERARLLERVIIVDPFHPSVISPLNFCVPVPGYPTELLAEDLLGGLRRLFPGDGITARMEVLLRNTIIALIEGGTDTGTLSLLEARDLLTDAAFRERVLLRVKNEETRAYFTWDFPRESRGTIEAVKSRLAYLLLSDQVRLSFGGETCVQFRDAIERGNVLLINLGKTLFATDKAREVMGTLLLSSFLRAVFARPMNHGPYMLAFMDEFQNFVLPGVFERLYTEVRAYRCFITAICQQLAAQIASRTLREIILNNVRYITLFSSNEEDSRLLGRIMFRPTGCLPKPTGPFSDHRGRRFYTEAEELEHAIRRVPSLKRQRCFLWDKESPFGAQPLSTCTVPEPYVFAGIGKEEFARFCEELEPLWGRMGMRREDVKKIIERRREKWGIQRSVPVSSSNGTFPKRQTVYKKLEAHLGRGA